MSQLFFTSSKLPDEKFNSLEEAFSILHPSEIILIFDTNVVIDFRDFYFNPVKFTSDAGYKSTFDSVKYLIEKTSLYNLNIGAQFALEECCRSVTNFKLNHARATQTVKALKSLFSMDAAALTAHIANPLNEEQIRTNEKFPESKMDCLTEPTINQFKIILAYAASLKIYDLTVQVENNTLKRLDAMMKFLHFMDETADVFSVSFTSYAFHLFGGFTDLKPIIFSKERKDKNKRLHKIFNGSIDLIFPDIADTTQSTYMHGYNSNLTPVFVTRDKYLSVLHSTLNTYGTFDDSKPNFGIIEKVMSFKYLHQTKWTEREVEGVLDHIEAINKKRLAKSNRGPRSSFHLLDKIYRLEENVKRHF